MKTFLRALAAAFLIAISAPADARFPRGTAVSAATGGGALMNVGDTVTGTLIPSMFTNILKSCSTSANAASPSDWLLLDADGYPTSKPTNIMLLCQQNVAGQWTNVSAEFGNPTGSNRMAPFLFSGSDISSCAVVTGSVTITGCTGSGNTTFKPTVAPWAVTFTIGSGGLGTVYFDSVAGASYSGSGEIALYRNANTPTSDKALYQSGLYFTQDYINGTAKTGALCGASPGIMRFMPWTNTASGNGANNWNNNTVFANRSKVTNVAWQASRAPSGSVVGSGGTITVTNNGTTSSALVAAATSITTGSLTDGEVAIGIVNVANTSQTITLDVKSAGGASRGAKTVTFPNGALPNIGQIDGTNLWTFVYSGTQDQWIATVGGLTWTIPLEAEIQAANSCGSDGWFNQPPMAPAPYTTSWVDFIRDNITGNAYFEYSNEVWNFGFGSYGYAINSGRKLGWVDSSNQGVDSWYALRSKLLSDIVVTEFAATPSRGRPTLEYQGCCLDIGVGSSANRFEGAQLIPNKVTTATVTFTGGTPCVVTWSNSGFFNTWPTSYTSTLTLPAGITSAHTYNVLNISGNTFNLEDGVGTGAIPCTGNGTGTITGNYTNPFYAAAGYGNFSLGSPTFSRPIDQTWSIGGAAYAVGENLCAGPDVGCTLAAYNGAWFQCVTNAIEGGSTAGCPASTAIGLVDWDLRQGRAGIQNVTCSGTTITTPAAIIFAQGAFDKSIAFQVTGGTICNGLTANKLYFVSSTSTTSCPGAVICNFTVQEYVNGTASGVNVAVSNGTGTTTVGASNHQNLVYLSSVYFPLNQSLAAKYTGANRPSSGVFSASVKGIQYESQIEPLAGTGSYSATPASCTLMGVISPAAPTVAVTGATTFNSTTIRLNSTVGVFPGMVFSGGVGDIPAGTWINYVNYDNTVLVSAPATGSNSGQSLTLTGNCISDANNAITQWDNDNASSLGQQAFFNTYVGKDASYPATFNLQSNMKYPASLSLMCSGAYTMINGCIPTSPKFKLYDGYGIWSRANP